MFWEMGEKRWKRVCIYRIVSARRRRFGIIYMYS
jgi:hypothetical protein